MPSRFTRSHLTIALLLALGLLFAGVLQIAFDSPDRVERAQMQRWIEEMKTASRGPFYRIRWFCNDGSVLPPGEYVCRERGGGVQHGEWNERTLAIRAQGYLVGTLLADLDTADYVGPAPRLDDLRQILLEQFLIENDDGWVFRQARYYRGAIQVEDERRMARELLLAMVDDPAWRDPSRYLLLREAARLLPIDSEPPAAATVRQLAIDIAEQDPGFQDMRVKLHGLPDARDPQRVRDYAAQRGLPQLADDYRRLAAELDTLYAPQTAVNRLAELAAESRSPRVKSRLQAAITGLRGARELETRLHLAADHAVQWRRLFMASTELAAPDRLTLLQAGLALEQEAYAVGSRLAEEETRADRLTRLRWLASLGATLHAAGFLSDRQWQHLDLHLDVLALTPQLAAETYAGELRYVARVSPWAHRALGFHFDPTVERWTDITPLAVHYIPDRLRGSPLLTYSRVLDTLLEDANRQIGVRHELFGREVAGGLRALNPGLRRGVLLMPPADPEGFRTDGIYLLPSTTPELPPVAGILTRGEGSSLSHVQLLARNLGIPNVVLDDALLPWIEPYLGRRVVLAVTPRGRVQIAADGPEWNAVFGLEAQAPDVVIVPDLRKLDLRSTGLRPLGELRARDSGRTVGPKAANLGELAHHYPAQVNRGLVVPFGVFREFLNQPIAPGGPAAYDWLRAEYARLQRILDPAQRQAETRLMLERLRHWIVTTDPGDAFREQLHTALVASFGSADTRGIFVRSDTNVEDLPGFTGAGLNRTVPNVVGFESIVQAIQAVWASPFSERAYAWRQAHMRQPEHVYPAVLLLETFPSNKSGVLVTADIETGDHRWLSIAVNEGVGGAVDGQAAEELRVHRVTGETRLLAQATAPRRTEPAPGGGMRQVAASGRGEVLTPDEIEQLRRLANDVERRIPMPITAHDRPAPADIEFGFNHGRLALFQIRPVVDNPRARRSLYLTELDDRGLQGPKVMVDLTESPGDR
ncbi:MAG TPA: phosphoenolpyruvate synthase [Thioalkalivibrio sp.]|nr:phosphoenolpyruvate synthase [Thioalkalivibrio sp.]